jgi:hypothetical protein
MIKFTKTQRISIFIKTIKISNIRFLKFLTSYKYLSKAKTVNTYKSKTSSDNLKKINNHFDHKLIIYHLLLLLNMKVINKILIKK